MFIIAILVRKGVPVQCISLNLTFDKWIMTLTHRHNQQWIIHKTKYKQNLKI